MPEKVRSFFAIPISKPIKDQLLLIMQTYQQKCPGNTIKWVEQNNIHLTIKFIGEIDFKNLNHLANQIHQATDHVKSFDLLFSKVGVFPSIMNPKVLWVGCQITEQLANLYKLIDTVCVENRIMSDSKPLSPHITIGRVKSTLRENELTQLNNLITNYKKVDIGRQQILKFFLYKSELRPGGPIYTPHDEYELNSII